jgi:hypothetical protein
MTPTTRSIVTEIHLSWISSAILVFTVKEHSYLTTYMTSTVWRHETAKIMQRFFDIYSFQNARDSVPYRSCI